LTLAPVGGPHAKTTAASENPIATDATPTGAWVSGHGNVADEQLLGGLGLLVGAAVSHRLPAAGVVEGVVHLDAELLQQLQGRHPHLRIEHVDVTGNHQSHTHS
jgi:hypothetical protein